MAGRAKRLAFTLGALVGVPVAVLGLLEGGLRLTGTGFDPGFFVERTVDGRRILTDNPRFGWRFFPPDLARSPQLFAIDEEKPPGAFRIFVLGGSAAMGDPAPASGLPRILQAMLEECRPDLRVEVVSAAMTAINSHVVLPIARDCLERRADLLVVYLGNNEVVGPFGAGSVFGIPGAGWRVARANIAVKSTRLGQMVERALRALPRGGSGEPEAWRGMELFLGGRLSADDPKLSVVYGNLRRNLDDICRASARVGVPVVVSSVGVNLRSCAPFASAAVAGEQAEAWRRSFARGVERDEAGDLPGALAAYREAAAIEEGHAELRFRTAGCLLALGDSAAAAAELRAARDLDVLRFRADSGIQEVIRSVSEGRGDEGIHFADGAAAFAAASPAGLPGHELFDDHVHPNFRGNWVLGRAIAETVLPLLPGAPDGAAGIDRIPDADQCAARIAYGPWKRHATVETMQGRRELAPFTEQIDAGEWAARMDAELRELAPLTQPAHLRRALTGVREQLARHPEDWMLREELGDLALRTGDAPKALTERRALARLFAHSPDAWYQLGETLIPLKRRAEAMEAYERAVRLSPRHFLARFRLGEELLEDGKAEEALVQFREAARAHPTLARAHRNAGAALLRLGRPREAVEALERAIAVGPELASAHKKLGDAWAALGDVEKAAAAYRAALERNPEYRAAREKLDELSRP